jgi:hypothetical protein
MRAREIFLDFFDFRRNFFSLKKFPEIPPQSPAGLNATRIFAPCYFLPEIAKNPVYFLSFEKKQRNFLASRPTFFGRQSPFFLTAKGA